MANSPSKLVYNTVGSEAKDFYKISAGIWKFLGIFHSGQRIVWRIFKTSKNMRQKDYLTDVMIGATTHAVGGQNKIVNIGAQTLFIAVAITESIESCLKIQHSVETLSDIFTGRYVAPIYLKWKKHSEKGVLSPSTRDTLARKWHNFCLAVRVSCLCTACIFKSLWEFTNSTEDAAQMFFVNPSKFNSLKSQAIIEWNTNRKKLWTSITDRIPDLASKLEQHQTMLEGLFRKIPGNKFTVASMIEGCKKASGFKEEVKGVRDEVVLRVRIFGNNLIDGKKLLSNKAKDILFPEDDEDPHFINPKLLPPCKHYFEQQHRKERSQECGAE